MKNIFLSIALLAAAGSLFVASSFAEEKTAEAPAGFESLFNGKDLMNWKGKDGFWSVQDGAITGETKEPFKGPNTFLVYQGGDVANFELRFKYKIIGGNSGVQYRSKVINEEAMQCGGYQGDFEAGKKYSGILYNEQNVAGKRGIMAERGTKVTWTKDNIQKSEPLAMSSEELQKTIKAEDWNEYTITAEGNHLVHKINGHVTVDVTDESPDALKSGILAIQVHGGPPMKVQVKDIWLKKL